MMYRLLLVVFGLVELVFPRAVLRLYTTLTYQGSEEIEPRDWVVSLARAEGLFLLLAGLRGFRKVSKPDDDAAA